MQWLGSKLRLGAGAAALTLVLTLLAPGPVPVQAQGFIFDSLFGNFPRGPSYHRRAPVERSAPAADFSKAPAPKKPDTTPTTTVLVLGDSLADWLASGLEDALADMPEFGIVRKNRTYSGLIRYDSRSETPDWPTVAREAIAADKPGYIVMMVGLYDRQSLRERVAMPPARGGTPGQQPPAAAAPAPAPAQPQSQPQAPADAERSDQEQEVATPEPPLRVRAAGLHEFRSEKWAELYGKRIDDTIAVLKSRGVPVLWVGLPSIRGTRSTADVSYLNDLFRTRAEKAGITYIDVWDGFVDEGGRFTLHGPDTDGQSRRLRTGDGVHFTKAGARKLAHYVEREIRRLATRPPVAVALPTTEPQPQTPAGPRAGGATARPLAGPVVPLTASANPAGDDQLVGGGRSTSAAGHESVTRVLVKGEAVPPPAGRGDDFSWPRRGVAPFGSDPVVATTTLPLPVMQAPPAKTTVAAPTVETPSVARTATVVRRTPAQPRHQQAPQQRTYNPFPFFPFFR